MTCLLAVDSGGTKCEALLTNESGRILGFGRSDYTNRLGERNFAGLGRAEATVEEAISLALSDISGIDTLHVCGRLPVDRSRLSAVASSIEVHDVHERDAPLALVGTDTGIVVLAGTGAFVFGRNRDGQELHLDGIGPVYGDHGSAYQIGLAAIRASGRADWSPRFQTSLQSVIPIACRALAGNPAELDMVAYLVEPRDRSEIGSLAKLVDYEAMKGDAIAKQILFDAADDIFDTIQCVIERLNLAHEELPLIGAGGVATGSLFFWDRIIDRTITLAPQLKPTLADSPQVCGLILAMAQQVGIASQEFRSKIIRGYGQALFGISNHG